HPEHRPCAECTLFERSLYAVWRFQGRVRGGGVLMSELFDAVDALVASRSPLPPPAERRRLRQAHALTLDEVASALAVRRATVGAWEAGRTEPRPPEREAYARLLKQLAELY